MTPALILVGLAGLFLLIGWAGETFFAMPPAIALAFYLAAYVAGGHDVATHASPVCCAASSTSR